MLDTSVVKKPNLLKGIDEKYLEGFVKTKQDEMVTLLNVDLLLSIKEI
ncbi:MAG: hypothetical protein GXO40_01305, partial [Epsilonproteobacteria bacterium]|nr:hypothetical protein [Campylobacterota bacterium]